MPTVGVKLWQADPHQFGPGKIHIVNPADGKKTFCGQFLSACPGKVKEGGNATCKICLNAEPRRLEREEWERERRRQDAIKAAEREQERIAYRERYHAYLQTPEWRERSQAVLRRAGFVCEGCGKANATQAHHLSYDHVGNEFLWELRAVCRPCHERFHNSEPG